MTHDESFCALTTRRPSCERSSSGAAASPCDDGPDTDLLAWGRLLANRPRRPLPEHLDARRLMELPLPCLVEMIAGRLIDPRFGSTQDDVLLLKVAVLHLLDDQVMRKHRDGM